MRKHTVARPRASHQDRPQKTTRKGRETDEAFRAAARTVFARDGYLNARISDIAAEAGKSVASFYNYYDTKADLLIVLAEEFHAEATQLAVLPYRSGLTRPGGAPRGRRRILAHLFQAARRADRGVPGGHARR